MADQNPASKPFDQCADHLALDFVNTVDGRGSAHPVERFTGYPALIDFGEQFGLIDAARAARLRSWAATDPEAARAIAARTIELRDALYDLFACVAEKRPAPAPALATLNRWRRSLQLDPTWAWRWAAGPDAPDAVLERVLVTALELLTSPRRDRVRTCGADDCLWLFLDTSKNGSRRWCDMNQCGNRTKARRFYQRKREATDG